MSIILGIETATKICSVAISDGEKLLAIKEEGGAYSHSQKLTVFIQEVLDQAGKTFKDIDAVAVSKGPGSYTGLRIGVSSAKGLCYALGIPLIAVDTLQAMAKNTPPNLPSTDGEGMPRYYTTDSQMWNLLLEKAKEHRKKPTEAEMVLWKFLRTKQLGYKFRRQHPVDRFIPDFVCIEKKLIIEVDGKIHEFQKEEDKIRTEILNENGFKVIRFKNEEVICNIDEVVSKIKAQLQSLPSGEIKRGLLFCPMIDARRMEVYTALFDENNNLVEHITAKIIDEYSFAKHLKSHKILFFGDGAEKCKEILSKHPNAIFTDSGLPSAKTVNEIAHEKFNNKEFEDVAYFEPYYLKDFIATTAKKLL
ncbi:MAG: tRNA (adenosine(37)-N6)-threonylcarbamoyltransferase complex dimerization subunit type 1 TsaB [Bacteroidetes bacterium RIFCSPLOWO2_12_FULL_31_6]|nr:MAG: tRNA (adenosine(37)-N6)-threonylcarbamoyltransferase complex dimerization subunit type 1 TsaB [Bacteroidetes bacterium RIFCSPLOWO2_12_FULL_31_6]